ncbi:MAG TPA: hypothetical protein PKA64_16555, partial [Myxococcota bacterium]|nr:hypothetical protein [Myxococcota bacterium]
WLYDPRADAWTVAGTMSARRADHAAVLVTAGPDAGSVLILGGGNGPVPYGDPAWQATASVDRFDPATGRLAPWTPLNDARAKFAIAALPDGTFLVTGGVTTLAVGAVPTAERVNTLTGSVDRLSGMNRPRYGHTATPLPDGRVLIAGDGSAERYDPATGTFDPIAARPLRPRTGATATATSDGRVLFAGGEEEDLLWGSVESWDPTAGGFVFVGGLQTPRTGHTATLLTSGPDAGAVLVLGGELTATQASVAELVR